MKIPFNLIMMNYPVNSISCDAEPAKSSFNSPEETGAGFSFIEYHGYQVSELQKGLILWLQNAVPQMLTI